MDLTDDQLLTLKTAVLAETDPDVVLAVTQQNFPFIAGFYNQNSAFIAWRSTTPVDDIFEAINWKRLTPEDAPDGTTLYTNISLACQGRQFNVQTMLVGRETIASKDPSVRQGLNDALTNVPSGVAGATQAAGWTGVKAAMTRLATRGEEIFVTGTGTSGSPGDLVIDGNLVAKDIQNALLGA